MKNIFSTQHIHTVTDANINFYKTPFVHPKRNMGEHDFIYLLEGQWEMGQNGETYELTKDSLLILFAGNDHYGISPCSAGTKTMYFHVSFEKGDIFTSFDDGSPFVDTLIDASQNPNIKRLFADVVNYRLSGEGRKADLCFEFLLCELTSKKCVLEKTERRQRSRA